MKEDNLEKRYKRFFPPVNGIYWFQTKNKDHWMEEFIDAEPTGKFGPPPNFDSEIIRFTLVE